MNQNWPENLLERYPALSVVTNTITGIFELMRESFSHGGKLLVCGNGGSAADAEHLSGELLKGFKSPRPLSSGQRTGLNPYLAEHLQQGLPVIPLNGFLSLSSAFANDVDPKLVYAQLVWTLGCPGDLLLGISTSGQAANVCLAAEAARGKGMSVLGLTGRGGGRLAGLCDLCIKVPSDETFMIQEYHLPVYHILCLMLEDHFFPSEGLL